MTTAISANPGVDLTTVSDLAAWLAALQLPTPPTPQLQQMVTGMSASIQAWLGYNLIQADYVSDFDGRGAAKVAFPNSPVTAISLLTVDGLTIPPAQGVCSFGYVFSTSQRQSWLGLRGWRFYRGMLNCHIEYTAGYAAGSIPPALIQACREAISALSQTTGREPGLITEKVGGLEEQYAPPSSSASQINGFVLTPTITLALMPLRRVVPAW